MSRRTSAREAPAPPAGLDPYAQIRGVAAGVRDGLHAFVGARLADAGLALPVTGLPQALGDGPAVLLLTYQTVIESQPSGAPVPLVPQGADADRSMVPEPWRSLGRRASALLVDHWPKRASKGPGLGPLDPSPPLAALPAPLRAWFEARPAWLAAGTDGPRARLPFVGWRQAFPMAVRVAALVPVGRNPPPDADRVALEALAVLAGAVRLGRSFEVDGPAFPASADLHALVDAFAALAGDPELRELADATRQPRRGPVGLTPHHELGDSDLAEVARTLGLPIQPGIVFSIRLALGAGPELAPGAVPHLGSVATGDR